MVKGKCGERLEDPPGLSKKGTLGEDVFGEYLEGRLVCTGLPRLPQVRLKIDLLAQDAGYRDPLLTRASEY